MDKDFTQRKSYSNEVTATVTVIFVKTIACVNQSKIIDTKVRIYCVWSATQRKIKLTKEYIYRQYISIK